MRKFGEAVPLELGDGATPDALAAVVCVTGFGVLPEALSFEAAECV
jgi:hypothetical protein